MATNYKILGQAAPADTSNADLYTVPSATQAVISTIHVANVSASVATCRIFVRNNAAAASTANAIAYDVSVPANSLFAITEGITIDAADVITVRSSVASALTFHAFGSEVTP